MPALSVAGAEHHGYSPLPQPQPPSGGIRGLFGRAHTCSLSGSCRVISQKLVT